MEAYDKGAPSMVRGVPASQMMLQLLVHGSPLETCVLSDAPWLSRHTFRKSQRTRRNCFCSQTNGPKVAASPGGDRDDLVNAPSLRGGRLVRHGGFLRRQRLGCSVRPGLYDGKSEQRREHHAVCRARRSGQQLRPGRATLWPGRPHGAVRCSTGPADAFQSFPRLRLQRHAS
jgi:hypothetical protein